MPKSPSEEEEEDEILNQSDLEQDAINTYYAVRMGHGGAAAAAAADREAALRRRDREGKDWISHFEKKKKLLHLF